MRPLHLYIRLLLIVVISGATIFFLLSPETNFSRPSVIVHQKDDSTYVDSINYVISIYQLEKKQFDLRQHESIYEWQHKSTIIIFITVILVVLMGLYLSYQQFEFTNKVVLRQLEERFSNSVSKDRKKEQKDDKKGDSEIKAEINSFEIGKGGIKITSAVIGLIILAMSIAFFFLYLKFVYPIHLHGVD
ncbi:MAG: hypothetical protein JWR38_2853 [Mucilaginibacter sp.]|nr:hypothetical protein [Mucilaginibacter sp.]